MKKLLLFFMSLFSLLGYSQLSEDFENPVFPPPGWDVIDNGTGTVQSWTRNTALAGNWTVDLASASSRPEVGVTGLAQDWLITPQVNVPVNGQVRFFSKSTSAGEAGSVYRVLISTATQNIADFTTTLETYTELEINNGPMDQKFILLDAYAGQNVYIAFVHEVTDGIGDRWLLDNVNVDVQCLQPDNLTVAAIGDTSVDLGWDNISGASEWEIEYGPAGFVQGTGTLVTGVTTNPFTLNGLTAATTYDFYVRAICGLNNPSPWSDSGTFTTGLCPASQQCDFVFRMTDSFGDGWNGARMTITQLGQTVAVIGATFTAGAGPVNITVPLCSGQPFELTWTTAGTWPAEVGVAIIDPLGATIFTKAPGTGTPNSLLFSGIAACTPPTCPEPSNVVVSGVNTNSGTITWTDNTSGSATQWQVIIQPAGSGYPPSGAEIIDTIVFVTNYSFSGLSSDTQYEVYISAICDPSGTPDPSFYEGPINFATTPDYCSGDNFYDAGGPTANYANNSDITWTICPNSSGEAVTVFFNLFNTEQNWDALYVFDGPTTASPQILSGNPAGNVPGGLPGGFWGTTIPGPFVSTHPTGCLTFRFRSDGSVNNPGWDATVVCDPPPTCIAPSGLTVSNLTEDGATFQWTDNNTPPATSWNIVIQPVGSGYPNASAIVIPAGTNPFTVTGLNPNTPYEYYVQSDCGGGDVSFWSGPRTFSTLFPGCGGSEPASNDCPNAPPICNLNGYCGNTSSTYTVNTWPELSAEFCGSIENNSFIKFEAASTSISMNVDVGNCTNGSGIQFMIFQTATCGSGPVNEIGCFFQMDPGINALTFNGLTPGVTYYLMIDGFAGAVCDYSVTVTSGGSISTDVEITQADTTICVGESFSIDATGGNGVFNWTPDTGLNTITGSSVIFTPTTPGTYTIQVESTDTNTACATSDFIEITVLDTVIPSFVNLGPFCSGDPAVTLPTTSGNGVTGLWTLAGNPVTDVDTSVGGIFVYTFTPDPSFQCSPVVTMDIEVLATCTFNSVASAVLIENCETTAGGEFFNTTGSGSDAIGDLANVFPNIDYGVFVQNSGNLIFRGGELRTFKTPTSNVCGANLYYRIYEASSGPVAFVTVPLINLEDCVAGSYPTGGTCDPDDQKWFAIDQVVDLTSNIPGDYILEVYYDFIGDSDSNTGCDETVLDNNAGANFVANFTIQQPITFTQTNEECGSSNATITISGFNPGSVYSVTYNDDAIVVGPVDYQADINGDIVLTGLNAGTYSDFNFVINGCSIFEATPINITNFSPSIVGVTNNSPICFGNDAIFTVEGTPNFDVDYTVNGGISQSVTLDASGFATITVVAPASGTVDLTLTNIYNAVCNIVVSNTSSVVVNPLPTATISAPSPSACIGSDATFIVTGTPNASVTYTVNGGVNQVLTLDASGNFTLNISSVSDVQVTLVDITDTATGCSNVISAQVANVAIIDVPEATVDIVQPTCAAQEGTIEVTSPLISQINFPGDLFISQVTDAQPGGLTYVEIYNATGGPVDLSNYRLIIYLNGATTTPAANNLLLSGTLANDDVVVIRIASATDEGGVIPDLAFPTASGVNNNDRIVLASAAGVEIDTWGTLDNSAFTPGQGYDYQRITTGTLLPTNTFDNADWIVTDWAIPSSTLGDYSDVGFYTLYASNYEYTLSDGTTSITQSTTTFNNVAPGTYTLVVHDTASNCFSDPISITINPAVFNDPVTSFSYITPVCNSSSNLLPDTSTPGFTSGGQFTSSSGIILDAVTGEIDVMNSSPGTYIITYSVISDANLCLNAGSSTFEVVISPIVTLTLEPIEVCINAQVDFPVIFDSNNSEILGSWSDSSIITSIEGSVDYIFTPNDNCTLPITYTVVTNVCTIQKGISPNGDGLNDSFDLSSFNVRKLQIFNRYGTKVYGRSNYSNEWSGQSDNGNELPTGTYYYVIEFNDSPSKTGWIYINREE